MEESPKSGFSELSQQAGKSSLLLSPGTVVDERYEIVSTLGSGGMCMVYKAKHLLMDRMIALKVLHKSLVQNKQAIQRFLREGLIVSQLEHENIVKIYGVGNIAGQPYMAMEYLEGENLELLLKQEGRIDPDRALPIANQILDALYYAHQRGVVHRDIKPSNILLVGDGVKLLDFGIAKVLPESGNELQKLTITGELLGTLPYMSPEQCRGNPADHRSDIFSTACLIFTLLDGEPPFLADSAYESMSKRLYAEVRNSPYIKSELAQVIKQALSTEPLQRPQSARELQEALNSPQHYLSKHKLSPANSKSTQPIAMAAVLVLVLVLACASLFRLKQSNLSSALNSHKHDSPSVIDRTESPLLRLINVKSALENAYYHQGKPNFTELDSRLDELLSSKLRMNRAFIYSANLYKAVLYTSFMEGKDPAPFINECLKLSRGEDGKDTVETAEAKCRLARLYIKKGDYKHARKTADEALRLFKKLEHNNLPSLDIPKYLEYTPDPKRITNAASILSECANHAGNFEESSKWLDYAIAESNQDLCWNQALYFNKADFLYSRGKLREAAEFLKAYKQELFEFGLENRPDPSEVPLMKDTGSGASRKTIENMLNLGTWFANHGYKDLAIESYNKLVKLSNITGLCPKLKEKAEEKIRVLAGKNK